MITIYYKESADDPFIQIDTPKPGCWIHVDEASTGDINQVSELIHLEYTDIYDCLDRYEIPRIERIDDNLLIFTRHPAEHESGLYTTTFTILITKDYFITICPQKSNLVPHLLAQKPKLSPDHPSKFLIYILLKITQEYTLQIKKIRTNVLKQEKKLAHVESKDIVMLTLNEEILNQYLSSLIPLRNVLESITSGKFTLLYDKDQDLLEDLLNASIQSENLCTINLRSIRSLRDSYQIIFTNQLNKTIKLLTALTIILSIPTMIASLYGMNVQMPYQTSPYAFSVIIAGIIGILILSIVIFQRKKWL